ncbi:MAG: c-type cytochrome [Rhizobiales bacterium]|nr:c-type cytochrome [Hyphomicrobiales bacterium]
MRATFAKPLIGLVAAALVCGGVIGGLGAAVLLARAPSASASRTVAAASDADAVLAVLKAKFRRPPTVPFPADNPYSDDKHALGEALFHDPRLSANGTISCASCHVRTKGFADGRTRGEGVAKRPIVRHTPTLWNLAWATHVFWDGRARSLEEQVAGPIESPDEMGLPMAEAVRRLAKDPALANAFAKAFPRTPEISRATIAKAIAVYERTLVSPPTRFDRWIEGDAAALTRSEVAGFRLFTGKAGCSNCHSGFAFTDYAFHDIGRPDEDRGRGTVLRLEAAEHAFKTPGLREIGHSAPYMHDGSLKSLDEVSRHYENGIIRRSTLSKDLPTRISLTDRERADLIAFLRTLDSATDPRPPARIVPGQARPALPVSFTTTVTQHEKRFDPAHIGLKRGARLWILNNDTRTHNARVFAPKLDYDSGAQEPGETVEIAFPHEGEFLVFCGIHPNMELWVDVAR